MVLVSSVYGSRVVPSTRVVYVFELADQIGGGSTHGVAERGSFEKQEEGIRPGLTSPYLSPRTGPPTRPAGLPLQRYTMQERRVGELSRFDCTPYELPGTHHVRKYDRLDIRKSNETLLILPHRAVEEPIQTCSHVSGTLVIRVGSFSLCKK